MNEEVLQELIELHSLGVASLDAVEAAKGDLSQFNNMKASEIASLLMELHP
jgi:hypothetical protein